MYRLIGLALLASLACVACDDRHLRGSVTQSSDGKTYLAVIDDNGGHCGPIKVDRKLWPLPVGQAGLIQPGRHTIECGTEIEFTIPPGVVFKFDYWGP